ncbi:hypothetical protein HAAEEKHM_00027 [Sinorhizobium phage AP-16-3]|nr:hypothetical protein HAAEEKHM_00027 [Sinorhizobium phage AP-16-3]
MTFQQSMSVDWQDDELDQYVQDMKPTAPVLKIDADEASPDTLRRMLTSLRRDRPIVLVRGSSGGLPNVESILSLAAYSRTGNVFDASGAVEFSV